MSFERAPFFIHLEELWRRILFCLIAFAALTGLAYYFSDLILIFLTKPLTSLPYFKRSFVYTNLSEAFFSYLEVALFAGLVFSSPIFAFQLWRFILPSLYPEERRRYSWFFIGIPFLFCIGALAAYYIVCPMAWNFFLSFESKQGVAGNLFILQFQARLSEYLSLILRLMSVFGLGFQLPIIIILLNLFELVSEETLRKKRKYAFLLLTIIAAVVTPADFISPISLIIPTYLLYESALLWIRYCKTKKQRLQN